MPEHSASANERLVITEVREDRFWWFILTVLKSGGMLRI